MADRRVAEQRADRGPKSLALLGNRPEVERDLDIAAETVGSLAAFDALPAFERDLWLARYLRQKATCSDCGNPVAVCSDPHRAPRYPYRRVCYSTREREAAQAAYEALHEDLPWHDGSFTSWAKKQSPEHPYHFRHGVTVGVAAENLAPWDMFTTEQNASPLQPEHRQDGDQ